MGSSLKPSPLGELYAALYGADFPNQGLGAEQIANQWGLTRERLDEYALLSHERAAAAQDSGAFDAQITPVAGVTQDEGVRRGGTPERLAGLAPAFKEDG